MTTIPGLPSLVRSQFKSAQEAGALTFYATKVAILQCSGVPFQLRFSPALANKTKSNKPADRKPNDPFENPSPDLFITGVGSGHYLVLNKFPVIPDHFILATKDFKKQTDLLEEADLAAVYQCLKSYEDEGEELFGFFNCGDHSGASQSHRHIQFLPFESMRTGIDPNTPWDVLSKSLASSARPDMPFKYFASALPPAATSKQIYDTYRELYVKACQASGRSISEDLICETKISYNLGLTYTSMVLCPRTSEGMVIEIKQGQLLGPIALNGTVLGGTLLVKTEDEWNAIRDDTTKLNEALKAIGIAAHKSDHEGHL